MPGMVELRNVSKVFGSFTALQEVSFEIREGEFMTFLGPSGCGKTTCLRLISGFDTPTTGQILIGDKDVTFDPPYRRDVNQVFQSYALFPHLTIAENIAFGLRMKKVPPADIKTRVDRVVEMTALGDFTARKPAQLSGGQRQRVAIARAILRDAPVLLLDEATSALDAESEVAVQRAVERLSAGRTTLVVAHRLATVKKADRILVLDQGRIVAQGTHDALVAENGLYARLARLQFTEGASAA